MKKRSDEEIAELVRHEFASCPAAAERQRLEAYLADLARRETQELAAIKRKFTGLRKTPQERLAGNFEQFNRQQDAVANRLDKKLPGWRDAVFRLGLRTLRGICQS